MAKINEHYLKLKASYLFSDIAKRIRAFAEAHPDARIIRLGIGDVTQPLPPAVIKAMHDRGSYFKSNGGHPAPFLVRAAGEIEEVPQGGGMLLGIYPDPELVDQRLEMLPGDALVLFTDGLAERRDTKDDHAVRIRELLYRCPEPRDLARHEHLVLAPVSS